jgi:hypothetical protein
MKNWAKINNENVVIDTLVFDDDVIPSINLPEGWRWIQSDRSPIGSTYDEENNFFIVPKPFASWSLDENGIWNPPIEFPGDGNKYVWNEENQNWDLIE